MKNSYTITESHFRGIPSIDVGEAAFTYEDLYELIGNRQFMTTFILKPGPKSSERFGETVTGVISYPKGQIEEIEQMLKKDKELNRSLVKIDASEFNLTQVQLDDLKYDGLLIADIHSICFIPLKKELEYHDTGEKKVPNVIKIKLNPLVDYDILYQNYIASEINDKRELMSFEKEKFVGITLGINNWYIDLRLLKLLGFDKDSINSNRAVLYHAYKTREHRKQLTEKEK
jgi:hypothetical protein